MNNQKYFIHGFISVCLIMVLGCNCNRLPSIEYSYLSSLVAKELKIEKSTCNCSKKKLLADLASISENDSLKSIYRPKDRLKYRDSLLDMASNARVVNGSSEVLFNNHILNLEHRYAIIGDRVEYRKYYLYNLNECAFIKGGALFNDTNSVKEKCLSYALSSWNNTRSLIEEELRYHGNSDEVIAAELSSIDGLFQTGNITLNQLEFIPAQDYCFIASVIFHFPKLDFSSSGIGGYKNLTYAFTAELTMEQLRSEFKSEYLYLLANE